MWHLETSWPAEQATLDTVTPITSALCNRVLQYGWRRCCLRALQALLRPAYRSSTDLLFVLPDFQGQYFEDAILRPITQETIDKALQAGDLCPAEAQLLTCFLDEGSRGIYAAVYGRLAGYAWVQDSGEYRFGRAGRLTIPPKVSVVKNLHVFPEFRGIKLGQKLNAARLAMINPRRTPVVFIVPENRYAIRNWEKYGFQRALEVKQWRWIGGSWHMKLTRLAKLPEAEPIARALDVTKKVRRGSHVGYEMLCLALRLTGIPWLLRELYARRKVTIINYHDPAPELFFEHIAYFSRNYSFVSIDKVARALERHDFSQMPPKPLLVTIDDGHAGNAKLFGTLARYKVPAVVYAVAGVVDTKRALWFECLRHEPDLLEDVKRSADERRRELLKEKYGHTDTREYDRRSCLSAQELHRFTSSGGTVGSHTLFHPLLDQCDDMTGEHECTASRSMLEGMLGTRVEHFALPNGNADQRIRTWIQKAGYRTCRTTRAGWATPYTDPLALPNFGIADTAGVRQAAIQACGLWDYLKMLTKGIWPREAHCCRAGQPL